MGSEKKTDGERLETLESGMKEMKEGQQRMEVQLDNMMEMLNRLLKPHPQNNNHHQHDAAAAVSMSASGDVLVSLKNQHWKEPEKELETADSTSGSSVLKKYIVACYSLVYPIGYAFHFYLTEDIFKPISRNPYLWHSPKRVIRWGPPAYSRSNPSQNEPSSYPTSLKIAPNPCMKFLYSSKVDKDGVYAIDDSIIGSDGCLPKEFARIPLAPSELVASSEVVKIVKQPQLLTSMTVGKARPLIVEMGGSIFALSMHPIPLPGKSWTTFETATFEVYDPKNRGWNTLPTPPFSGLQSGYLSPSIEYFKSFSHFVVDDKKLFVSDGLRSWSFGSESWKECDLFSECFPNMKLPIIEDYCELQNKFQSGFPFSGEAILWKDSIYLCIIPAQNPPIAAFSIPIGQEKAIRVELEFGECNLFERGGTVMHLVNMGGDHVIVNYYDDSEIDDPEYIGRSTTIVMFKLFKTENGVSVIHAGERIYNGNHLGRGEADYCFALD